MIGKSLLHTTNRSRWLLNSAWHYLAFLLVLCLGVSQQSFAQNKQYADSQTHGINSAALLLGGSVGEYNSTNNTSIANVTNFLSAVDGDESTAATLEANLVNLLILGATGESWMQFEFQNGVAANKTTFIKVSDPQISGATLDLLGTVGGLLGLLQKEFIFTEVYNNGTQLNNANVITSVARDAQGNLYLAITPSDNYTDVRVKLRFQGQLLGLSFGTGVTMDIYEAFHYTSSNNCGAPLVTAFQTSGVDLSLLDFGNANLHNAIDADTTSYSIIKSTSLLSVSAGASFSQLFYFEGQSSNTSTLNIKLALGSSGLLNADLLGAMKVILYDGTNVVFEQSLQTSLLNNTDLLSLLNSGDPITVTFAPGLSFDRAEVRLNSTVGVGLLGDGLKVYDVQRYDSNSGCVNPNIRPVPPETTNPFDQASCSTLLSAFDNASYPQYAVDGNNESYATLFADSGTLLGTPISGFITFDMGSLAANQTTYVRINYEQEVLDRLLGGSLGKLVSDLAGGLLLGNQFIQVEALSGGSVILDESSSNAFEGATNGVVSVVQDKLGRYYLAITPNAAYDQVRITNHVDAVLPTGKKASLDVYGACFEIGTDACFPANFTSYKGGSILGLSVGDLSTVGVTNANHAIDGNSSSYSEINLGAASLGAYVYQTIYFNKPSQPNDTVAVRLQLEPSSTLSLGVLEEYKVKFYNGAQLVDTYSLGEGLINNLDLLSLFNTGGTVELNFTPSATFDRVDIGLESTVQLNVDAAPMRIYNVVRYGEDCPRQITPSPFDDPSCSTLLVDASNAFDLQNLFDDDFDSYATLKSGAGTLLGLGGKFSGFVELAYPAPMTAGTTSYIRIDFDEDILNALLSGTLGNITSDLLNGLVLGDHYFEVTVKNNQSIIASANSKQAANGSTLTNIRIVQDKLGRYYIAVTPDQDYTSVRITDHTDSTLGLLAEPNTMNVYGMCTELSTDTCLDAFATSYEYSGLSLGVNGIGTAGVKNPAHAIDDNTQNYSEISNGTLAVGAATTQWIYFNTPSTATDAVQIKFDTQGGAVNLEVLGGLEVKAYLGDQLVSTLDWGSGIVSGVNVLNLLSNGQTVEVPFKPGAEFDRISVGIKSLVNVAVFPPIRLYSVERCYTLNEPVYTAWKSFEIDGDPTLTEVEGGEEIVYTVHVRNTGGLDIAGLIIKDTLPENTTHVSGGTLANGIITFDNINVLVGETVTKSFTVKVNENLTGVDFIKNTAIVKLNAEDPGKETYPPLPGDPNNPDESGDTGTDIPVNKISSVVLWKAYDVDGDNTITTVSGGETVNYFIYARNTGNQDLTNLVLTDVLPDGLTYVSGGVYDGGTRNVTFTLASLEVGATSGARSFSATVNADLTGITEIKNIATAQPDTNQPVTESFPPIDNTTTPTEPDTSAVPGTVIDVTPVHAVVVSKNGVSSNANPGQAQIGDVVTYTISIENKSNETLTDVLVEDVLSANYTNITATVGGSNVGTFTGNAFSYTISSIGAGVKVNIIITADVDNIDNLDPNGNIVNIVNVTYRNSDDTADLVETAEDLMPTSCTPISAADITLPADLEICYNTEVTLDASTDLTGLTNPIFKWYKTADLSDVPFIGASLTETLTETTTYYVTLEADGRCVNATPAEITVTVGAELEIPTLTPEGGNTTLCEGSTTTLTAAVASGATGLTYQWFNDGVEIVNETAATLVVSEAGVYTAVAINATGCASEVSAGIEILLNPVPDQPVLDQTSPLVICEGQTDTLTTQAVGDAYRWYYNGDPVIIDETGGVITYYDKNMLVVSQAGNYTVQVIDNDLSCPSLPSDPVEVIVNPTPVINFLDGDMITVGIGETIDWSTVVDSITVEPAGATITWYDENQQPVDPLSLPTSYDSTQIGVKTFYLVAEIDPNDPETCSTYRAFRVNVYDPAACPVPMKRVYATVDGGWGSIITGGVSNTGNAVDQNPKTFSTITTGVGLLGIGTAWQNVKFDHTVPAGTPVTIKLGKEYSGVVVAGGLSVVGIGTNGLDIGVIQPVQGGLVDLLNADHVQEFTFIPVDVLGNPKPYTGVRISSGAVLSVAQNSKVYGVYYETQGQPSCAPVAPGVKSYVQDVLYGVKDLGLGVASALASVVDPWNSVDNDLESATTINRAVGVLNAGFITVKFKNQVMPTDSIRFVTKAPGNQVVTLNLLSGSIIQRYLGDTPVGDPILDGDVLQLKLLDFTDGKTALSVASYPQPYDAISFAIGNIVGVNLSEQFKIYDVSVRPLIQSAAGDTIFEVCQGEELTIRKQDPCTVYEITDAAGNLLVTTDNFNFTIPDTTAAGTYTYYVQAIRQGCTIGPKQEIEVVVLPKPEFIGINVNGADLTSPYAFTASPNDEVIVLPEIETNGGTLAAVTWEILNPNYDAQNPGTIPQWISVPAELSPATDATTGQLTLEIPDFGTITLPDSTEIDIRNTVITLRVSASNTSGCLRVSEDILMTVDGSSKFFSNPNIINKL